MPCLIVFYSSWVIASPEYIVMDLAPSGGNSCAYGINDLGQVVGLCGSAFLWDNVNGVQNLGTLSDAREINNLVQVVGIAQVDPQTTLHPDRPFLWEDGVMTDLKIPSDAKHGGARAINNNGEIVGYCCYEDWGDCRPTLWENGVIKVLPNLGGYNGSAWDINDLGQVVGFTSLGGYPRAFFAFFWENEMHPLPGINSAAFGINNRGQIVGTITDNGLCKPVLWENGTIVELGTEGTEATPYAINELGQVIGIPPFIWEQGKGLRNLNDLIDPASGWTIGEVYDINNTGQIVGFGSINGSYETHALLLIPIHPPVANEDYYIVEVGTILNVPIPGVLINDTDLDGDPLSAVLGNTNVSHGTLTLDNNGSFTYTPNQGFIGIDSFTYRARDASADSNEARVTIDVNAPPEASNDSYFTDEDTVLTVPIPGVLLNDTDPNGDKLSIIGIDTTGTQGQVSCNPDGSFNYDPNGHFEYLAAGETATDIFTYNVSDGKGGSDTASVTITINGVNDPPVAVDDSYKMIKDHILNIPVPGVLGNDTDIDGDVLQVSEHSSVDHGILTLRNDGAFTYIPHQGFIGIDSFTYIAYDNNDYSNVAKVNVEVRENKPPVAEAGPDQVYTLDGLIYYRGGAPIHFDGSNSYDPDGNIVSYEWDFDDGESGSGMIIDHVYLKPPFPIPAMVLIIWLIHQKTEYTVTLTVTDDDGATGTDTTKIIFQRPRLNIISLTNDFINLGQLKSQQFTVDPSLTQIIISANWMGSSLGLVVIDPDGLRITPDVADPEVEYVESATNATYTITNPLPGLWSIEVIGEDVLPEGEPFNVTVFGESSIISNFMPFEYYYNPGHVISIGVRLEEETSPGVVEPIIGAVAEVEVLRPDGQVDTLNLNDGEASDGIYAADYVNTDCIGSYLIKVKIHDSFERELQITLQVGATVKIDIKPGSFPNPVNPGAKGVIPVAILTTSDFDATTVDPLTVEFGPNKATEVHKKGHIEDIDSDGDLDIVLHFETLETGIKAGDTEACLTGKTVDGKNIKGCDAIVTVPKGKSASAIPAEFALLQNFSNPFNPDTWIPYQLAKDAVVTIRIFDVTGRLIRILELGQKQAGFYLSKEKAVYWDGRNEADEQVASGIYFYNIQAGDFTATKRMVISK